MPMYFMRPYGVSATINFGLWTVSGVDLKIDATFAAGDIKLMKDEGTEANTTNLPADEGQGYSLVLTATEMQAARAVVYVVDAVTKVWLDDYFVIETTGGPGAQHVDAMRTGVAAGGAAGTITLDSGSSATDDFYNTGNVHIIGGTGAGQSRYISDYVGSTKVATVQENWATNPDGTSIFRITPPIGVDAASISRDQVAADNLETMLDGAGGQTLSLKQINCVNSTGDAIVASSTGSNGKGINATGNGTGAGILSTGGATSGSGIKGVGGSTDGHGIEGVGVGSANGIFGTGGASGGSGIQGNGGASSGNGIHGSGGSTNGVGIFGTGAGTGAGLRGKGGATDGLGLQVSSGGNQPGAHFVGNGTGAGFKVEGGATSGTGFHAVGGALNGSAIVATNQGTGLDIDADLAGNITGDRTGNLYGSVDSVAIVDIVTALDINAINAGVVATGTITASKFAAGAIDAAAFAADAATEIADAVWGKGVPGSYGAGTAGKIIGDNVNATVSSRASQTSVDTIDDFLDTEIAAIKAKTDNLPSDPADQSLIIAATDAISAAIVVVQADTDNIQTRIPTTLVGGRMDASVGAINGDATAALNLARAALAIVRGAAIAGTLSTTQMTTDLTEATNDHYNGREVIWTTGTLLGQSATISDYDGATKMLTYGATTEAPIAADTFAIV